MRKSLSDQELAHLLHFVGYGVLNADVWFLGMEEAGGGEENIRARLKFRQVEDCAEAHKILGITKHHWGKKTIQRTWRGMCYIMLCLEGKDPTAENIRNYQADDLGRYQGNTLLGELMPIPKPSISDWAYEDLIPQYTSREDYYAKVKPYRLDYLHKRIHENHPKTIIAYGKSYWSEYQTLFEDLTFQAYDSFLVANRKGMKVILTDHFTARTMNDKFDEIVSIVRHDP